MFTILLVSYYFYSVREIYIQQNNQQRRMIQIRNQATRQDTVLLRNIELANLNQDQNLNQVLERVLTMPLEAESFTATIVSTNLENLRD